MYKPCIFGKASQGNFFNSCTNHENFSWAKKNFQKNFFLKFMYKPCIFGKESQGNFFQIHVQTMKILVWQKKIFFEFHVQTMYFW